MHHSEAKEKKTAFEIAEDLLRKFWRQKGKAPIIKARHTEIFIEPKVFLHGHLNPEIQKLLVSEYLSNLGPEDIAKGRVAITADLITIKDDDGSIIAQVRSKKLINSMINKITNFLGKALTQKKTAEGAPYVEPHEDNCYSFGEIKGGLIHFLTDMHKTDSKNLVRDAIVLIKKS